MQFQDYLEKFSKEINLELEKILNDFQKEAKKINPKLSKLVSHFTTASGGGKRIRGVLVKLGFEIASKTLDSRLRGNDIREVIKVAAAYEIFQTAILAHDDVIDKSLTRRGNPSIYAGLGNDHYGISQAISLGDMGFFLAMKIISETNFPNEIKNKAINFFSKTVINTTFGEMLDVEKADPITVSKLKTAQYSISGPLILGAILAESKFELLDKLDKFGTNLGIAFQIQDDILGVFGSEEKTGKSAKSDIREGKVTLLMVETLKRASKDQKKTLEKYYDQWVDNEKIASIRKIFINTGSLDLCTDKAVKYTTLSKKMIPKITKITKYRLLLKSLADYLVERTN